MKLVEVHDRRSPYAYDVIEKGVVIARVWRCDTGGWGFWRCEIV